MTTTKLPLERHLSYEIHVVFINLQKNLNSVTCSLQKSRCSAPFAGSASRRWERMKTVVFQKLSGIYSSFLRQPDIIATKCGHRNWLSLIQPYMQFCPTRRIIREVSFYASLQADKTIMIPFTARDVSLLQSR